MFVPSQPRLSNARARGVKFHRARESRTSASDGDDDLPLRVAVAEVAVRIGDVVELVAAVDHGLHLAGLDELTQDVEVPMPDLGDEEGGLSPARQPPGQDHARNVAQRMTLGGADDDQDPPGLEAAFA